MRKLTAVLAAATLALPALAAAGTEDASDEVLLGRVLALAQTVVHAAARSDDPRALERQVDSLLSGDNAEANRLAHELLGGALEDLPAQQRDALLSMARDFQAIAARARKSEPSSGGAAADALRARRELHAMGLRYYDAGQFLDAARRDDLLAVELYIAGRGVDLGARDAEGLTALERAQGRNSTEMTRLLASARR